MMKPAKMFVPKRLTEAMIVKKKPERKASTPSILQQKTRRAKLY
jgi:hypothetical protein